MPSSGVLAAQFVNFVIAGAGIISFSMVVHYTGSPAIMLFVFSGSSLIFTILNCIMLVNVKELSALEVQ